jgi:hypothetical protein
MKTKILAIAVVIITFVIPACGKTVNQSAEQINASQTQQEPDGSQMLQQNPQIDLPPAQQEIPPEQTEVLLPQADAQPVQEEIQPVAVPGNSHETDDANIEQQTHPSDDEINIVEDYAKNIEEYDIHHVAFSNCSKHVPYHEKRDSCNNIVDSNSDCYFSFQTRCLINHPNQCECKKNGNIVRCADISYKGHKEADSYKKSKFLVTTENVNLRYIYCDQKAHENAEKDLKVTIRKMCPIVDNKISGVCECYLIEDECGNRLGNGGEIVRNYKHSGKKNCLANKLGKLVNCSYPKLKEWARD